MITSMFQLYDTSLTLYSSFDLYITLIVSSNTFIFLIYWGIGQQKALLFFTLARFLFLLITKLNFTQLFTLLLNSTYYYSKNLLYYIA
jgi:hypothetical protein